MIKRHEQFSILSAFIILWFLFYRLGGAPIGSDTWMYMNTSLNNIPQTFIPFRYFHVYVQKFFLELAPSPLAGGHLFFAFQISLVACLIYLNVRLLRPSHSPLHGLFSALSFLLLPLIIQTPGEPLIDFSATVMISIFVTLYNLFFWSNIRRKNILLIFLGMVFYLGLNTKETTICIAILFLGLFFENKNFTWTRLLIRLASVLLGILCGMILLGVLNGIFLKDAFFSLRISTLLNQKDINETGRSFELLHNWFSDHIFVTYTPLFVLFLLGTYKNRETTPFEIRLLWLVPLILVIFLTLTLLPRHWDLTPRYFFPAMPIVCIFFPEFLDFTIFKNRTDLRQFVIISSLIVLVFLGLIYGLKLVAQDLNWDYANFLYSIHNPILLSVLIGIILVGERQTKFTVSLIIVCLFALNAYQIRTTVKAMVYGSASACEDTFDWYFHPYTSFAPHLEYSPDMKLLIPSNLYSVYGMLGNNVDEVKDMYNIYFDTPAIRSNFVYEKNVDQLADDLADPSYTDAILHISDWRTLTELSGFETAIRSRYDLYYDPLNILVFLDRK